MVEMFNDIYNHLDTILALDRRTELVKRYHNLHAVHTYML